MVKQTVLYTYNKVLFSLKRERNSDTLQDKWSLKVASASSQWKQIILSGLGSVDLLISSYLPNTCYLKPLPLWSILILIILSSSTFRICFLVDNMIFLVNGAALNRCSVECWGEQEGNCLHLMIQSGPGGFVLLDIDERSSFEVF